MPAEPDASVPIRVLMVTLDHHMAGAAERAGERLRRDLPGLRFDVHAAADWGKDPASLTRCKADIARADIVVSTMLFMDDHVKAVLPDLQARREHCDAMLGAMSASEVMKTTRLGGFRMDGEAKGLMGLLKRLKGSRKPGDASASSGAKQMAMLRRLPKILRFIPGTAQDVRAYFLVLQYFLAGSEENTADLVRLLVDRYASGPRAALRGAVKVAPPQEYLDVGLYHPRLPGRLTDDAARLPAPEAPKGLVGVLVMRSYVLAENTAHYDAVISALEARGLRVLPAFASGLDARPAVDRFFMKEGRPVVDTLLSLTGFSLIGGPAYSEQGAAEAMLGALDVPCVSAQALEFQTLEQWETGAQGLSPVEATMMVAIPELDGSIAPIVFGGRSARGGPGGRDMAPQIERVNALAARVARLVALRRKANADKRVAVTLFNFPPNAGAVGTAAYLDVFASLHNVMRGLEAEGYDVEVPATVDDLRARITGGNAERFGAPANIHTRIPVNDHVRREPHLAEIEAQWGPAPGKHGADGAGIQVWGERFGKLFVGVQPAFGYEGDPMRLLFEGGFAPTHHFSAYYRWLREDFGADAYLHFGTHGALEFMPGKQVGLSAACWPDRLIGEVPNVYLYAANNPSEGLLAKRRSGAVLISHMTPPLAQAGLYKGLVELKGSLDRWRALAPDAVERETLVTVLQAQASALDLAAAEPAWSEGEADHRTARLVFALAELEATLIPHGLHVVGGAGDAAARASTLAAMAEAAGATLSPESALALVQGGEAEGVDPARADDLRRWAQLLGEDHETPGVLRALAGRYVRPAAAGDLVSMPDVLPTGRNLHGFDPYRLPSAAAAAEGARQADRLLARHAQDGHGLPESIALVLWGSDTMKTEGGPVAQALALMGARARFDTYGRLCGAELTPLAELARPRIDVVMTLSGIFRDLLPLQVRMLAEAARLAAEADEPVELNFIRKHALARMAAEGCDLSTAALRVFSNAEGTYGANVNQLVQSGAWDDEAELAETFARRKGHAYGCDGEPVAAPALLKSLLAGVELTYQNLESVEMGVTTVDHYVDSLGGMTRAVKLARGGEATPTYIGDSTRGDGRVRTMAEQVALETRTRQLNPQWFEAMLAHGHEGVRQIETAVTNTLGLSATTGAVEPWVYQRLTETFVLDPAMRERLAALNPGGALRLANRLGEACDRAYWTPDPATLAALRDAGDELEDRLEGVLPPAAASAQRAPMEIAV